MIANELAEELEKYVGQLKAKITEQKVEINALTHYIEGQNRKILDLAFAKVYAERSLEIKDEFNALTDGEITILANKHLRHIECDYESTGVYEFARAVLKEAKG
jgi:hypothetical protein